jgi:hypothetical protein
MSLRLATDFRIKLSAGETFSSRERGFLFLESRDLPTAADKSPALLVEQHINGVMELITRSHAQCFWLVETATDAALEELKRSYPDHRQKGASIAGYAARTYGEVERFWHIRAAFERRESWNTESVWLMAGVKGTIPEPTEAGFTSLRKSWTAEHLLTHADLIECVFVQQGWFGYIGVRDVEGNRDVLKREFGGEMLWDGSRNGQSEKNDAPSAKPPQ